MEAAQRGRKQTKTITFRFQMMEGPLLHPRNIFWRVPSPCRQVHDENAEWALMINGHTLKIAAPARYLLSI